MHANKKISIAPLIAKDIAQMVLWLCSPMTSHVNEANIVIDKNMTQIHLLPIIAPFISS